MAGRSSAVSDAPAARRLERAPPTALQRDACPCRATRIRARRASSRRSRAGRLVAMIVLTVLTAVCACVLLLPTVSDLISLARATRRRSERPRSAPPARPAPPGTLPRLLVLVPAHNEELVLASCLGSLALQRYPTERLTTVVVADNCSDRTAAIAPGAGGRRLDRQRPGGGRG